MSTTTARTTIAVQSVSKRFVLRHDRSLKNLAVSAFRGKDLGNSFLALDDVNLEVGEGEAVALLGAPWPGWPLLASVVTAGLVLVTGLAYFRRAERTFADVI